jgi:diguanylate cyclase (GGDEF)-like protein
MKRWITPTLQISVGLLSLTISLIFIAYSFQLIPNEDRAAIETRARISENIAIQLASLAARNDAMAIQETINSVIGRNSEILSIAIRGANGQLLAGSAAHERLWLEPTDGRSTMTHLQVPLLNGQDAQGKIEIVFRPIVTNNNMLGLSQTMMGFICFIGIAGFAGYYLFLKRALRELDPGRAIPERVKAAFDTLAEGVLILDKSGAVLLANNAFVSKIHASSKSLLGINVDDLSWIRLSTAPADDDLPWRAAIYHEEPVLGKLLGIRDRAAEVRRLIVNATRIVDGKGVCRGVIATFDDVTILHQTNEQLNSSIDQLHASQFTISEQNKQLQLLASSDPLTGCLNRRTFFAEAELICQKARSQRIPMSFLMLDADHFKSVNDRFGHVVGDKVLVGLAGLMKHACGDWGLVGRYGGEEFCIAVVGLAEQDAEKLAETIRQAVANVTSWLPNGERVTISIGIASLTDAACEIADLVKRADEALYAAKDSGRNRFVNWRNIPPQATAPKLVAPARTMPAGQDLEPTPISSDSTAERRETGRLRNVPDRDITLDHIEAMIRNDKGGRFFAIARIDLDNLGYFNDRYGQRVGDALLVNIRQRITSKLRRSDMLSRFKATEFLLLLEPLESKQQIERIMDRIVSELKQPFLVEGHELFSSCSVGVSVYPEHGRSYEALQRNADSAMSRAKQSAKGDAVFFDFNMTQVASARMDAEQRLRLAVRDQKFCCAFQPKIDIRRQQVVGFEALIRWRDDNGDIYLPQEFIGLAVELGLIDQITNFALDIAIKSVDQLDAAFGPNTTISINVAPTLANDLDFMLTFTSAIRDSKISARIILELTEDSFIAKGAFQTVIIPILREIGVRVSIDDFGTGYSSLSALADITADEIKIDRSFISGIHQRPRNQSILRAINSLGNALNMTIVAEGVETIEELLYLQAATSIMFAQGFYFSKPFFLEDMNVAKKYFSESGHAETSHSQPALRSVAQV